MARKRFIQDPSTGRLVPANKYHLDKAVDAPTVMLDMNGYKSPLDGTWIEGRAQHRAHKRRHGVIEVGTEKLNRPATKKVDEKTHSEGIKREIANTLNGYGI